VLNEEKQNPIKVASPWETALAVTAWVLEKRADFIAYTKEVKKAQIDFQNAIQNAGIERISEMTTQEVLENFATKPTLH
jgi:hypothetical protein